MLVLGLGDQRDRTDAPMKEQVQRSLVASPGRDHGTEAEQQCEYKDVEAHKSSFLQLGHLKH